MAGDSTNIVPLRVPDRVSAVASPALRRRAWARVARLGLSAALGRARQSASLYLLELLTGFGRGGPVVRGAASTPVHFRSTVTVERSPRVAYRFWRDLANLPRFMQHIASVEDLGGGRSRWTARTGPGQRRLSWEAELATDRPGRCIAWRSVPGAPLHHAGRVSFAEAPGPHGCEVTLELDLRPAGAGVALALGLFHPVVGRELEEELRRFKQLLEAGEAATAPGQPFARGDGARAPEA